MDEIIKLINLYWRFDNNQHPISGWRDKQALIDRIIKLFLINAERTFKLTPKELADFKNSGSRSIRFDIGGCIGNRVYVKDKNGKWKDISDYSSW